jgi:hypothetical protein
MRRVDYPGFREFNSKYGDKVWKYIEMKDYEEAILSTWRLFRIEAKKFLNASDDHEKGFNVRLIDNLAEDMKFEKNRTGSLHKLRKLRNKLDKGGHVPASDDWRLVENAIEVLNLILTTNRPELVDGALVCPDCGAAWEDYDQCDWCGWTGDIETAQGYESTEPSAQDEMSADEINHEGRLNCFECGEKWNEEFTVCDWCGWPHTDED